MIKKYFLILIIFIVSCKENVKVEQNIVINEETLIQYKLNSKKLIYTISQRNDTIDIGSSGNLIYKPFGVNLSKKGLEKKFSIKLKEVGLNQHREGVKRAIYTYKNSKIIIEYIKKTFFPKDAEKYAEYKHQKPVLEKIFFTEINNPEIAILDTIKVGMKKKDFFMFLFNTYDDKLKKINVILNGDMPGDLIEQKFVFKNGKLKNFTFKAP